MEEAEKLASMRMPAGSSNAADFLTKESLCDLDGVQCEPTAESNTRWNFHCDGASYPCRLVNLPCPVELHKTHDHAMYYKSCDIAQLLVVYEDEMAMEEAENMPSYSNEDYPSYYHSGLTPPLKRVVERRFSRREHKAIPPPRTEVSEIEEELRVMIERISENSAKGGKGKNKTPSLSAATAKVIEEVVEELVDYQPWMDDHGREPNGVQFDIEDPRSTKYPELWLEPREINQIMRAETEKEAKIAAKKEEKKAKKKKAKAAAAASGKGKQQQTAAPVAIPPPAFTNSPPNTSMDVTSAIDEEFNAGAVDELDLDDDALFAGMDDDDILGDMDFGV
jgi:transcription initiation factor TFIID subunit 7